MDKRVEQIIEGFKGLLKGVEGSFIASVVEDKKTTVDVQDFNGTLYPDVRKIATKGSKGFVPKLPKNSFVLVSRLSKSDDLFISMMSEIEGIEFDVKNDIVINGGENDGLVKLRKLEDNLNKLEKLTKDLATNIYTWGMVLDTVAGGVVSINKTDWELMASSFQFVDMENEKIKH